MLMKHMFFATVLLSCNIEQSEEIPTAATDMKSIIYNPKFIEGLRDMDLILFVLAHEVMHIVLKHGLRRGSRNPKLWNIACDLAINWMLKKAGFTVWEKAYCEARFDGMSAEHIYEVIQSEGGKGATPGRGSGKAYGGDPDDEQGGMGDDLMPIEDLSPAERATLEQSIREMVVQAHSLSKKQGQMPAFLDRALEGVISPPLPWDHLLREYATILAKENETWSRRNRRVPGVYLPTRWSEVMGELVVIGDTSGSMPDGVFAQTACELGMIAEAVKPERIRVLWADDAECSREEVFEVGETIVLHPKGGGGTDMRKPLRHAENFNPIVVVLITDCETPWPKEPTPYPLIVVSTTRHEGPDWAKTVHFE